MKNINLNTLLQKNKIFLTQFTENNLLMKFIRSEMIKVIDNRVKLLDCLQIFSDHFQRVVMLRYALTDDYQHAQSAYEHFREEAGHNSSLWKDRLCKPPIWDPILEATASWFTWKMFTSDNPSKTVLVNLVLESSAHVFFSEANLVTEQYNETTYFKIHSSIDEHHQNLGLDLLADLSEPQYETLLSVQYKAWDMLNTACNQIACLVGYSEHHSQIMNTSFSQSVLSNNDANLSLSWGINTDPSLRSR